MVKVAKTKKIPGKAMVKPTKMPVYKPTVYLDGAQIPKELKGRQPGEKVRLHVEGVVKSKSQSMGSPDSMSIEMRKMAAAEKGAKK